MYYTVFTILEPIGDQFDNRPCPVAHRFLYVNAESVDKDDCICNMVLECSKHQVRPRVSFLFLPVTDQSCIPH